MEGTGAAIPALKAGETVKDVATCPSGQVVLGGGGNVSTSGGAVGALQSSSPTSSNEWTAVAVVTTGEAGGELHVKADAICGSP